MELKCDVLVYHIEGTSRHSSFRSTKLCHALGKVGKQGMPLQDEQRQYSAFVTTRMVLYGY